LKKEIRFKPHEAAHLRVLKTLADFRQQQAQDAGAVLESYVRTLQLEYNPSACKAEIPVTLDMMLVEE
jgi:hypothetical protein